MKRISELGKRVAAVRAERGLSLQQLAALSGGIAYQTIQDLEKGDSQGTKHILALARGLGVYPEWLETGQGPKDLPPSDKVNPVTKLPVERANDRLTHLSSGQKDGSQETLKVLGMAEGGPDGWSLWNGDVIETIRRPDNLIGVEGAYAVYVTGHSMEPRYNHGEHVHIHPRKPLEPGCYVLVQKKPIDGTETPLAVVKRLVRRSGNKVVLSQHNPPKQFDIKTDEIVSIHRVVGSSEP